MENKKIALVFGANGQDGSYMLEILLEKGYEVHGTIRRASVITTERIDHIFDKITLHYADVTDCMNIFNIISKVRPSEIYNFSAQSHVKISAELENYTFQVNTIGVLNILQSVKTLGLEKSCKIYQASTSETMGNQTNGSIKMNENTHQSPVSVYGISKYASQQLCNMYRDAYGMFVVNSILYNHESCRRGHNFVTQKIANYVAKYHKNMPFGGCGSPSGKLANKSRKNNALQKIGQLQLGNIHSFRDWGHARDYMLGVHMMLQQEHPQNFVLATGTAFSVKHFVELAFKEINIELVWRGTGVDEVGIKKGTEDDPEPHIIIKVNPKYYRDIEIDYLVGDASKAKEILGWEPTTSFNELVSEMVKVAIERA
jgi:GDPmannose 4,6-dehydratase